MDNAMDNAIYTLTKVQESMIRQHLAAISESKYRIQELLKMVAPEGVCRFDMDFMSFYPVEEEGT